MRRSIAIFLVVLGSSSLAMAQTDLDMVDIPNLNIQAPTNLKPKGVYIIQESIEPATQIKTYTDNVTAEEAEQARQLFKQANKKFEKRELQAALELYKKAYTIWPHPRILFNMGVTLALMGRPLEGALMFKKVLEYGPDPLTEGRYKEARDKYLELMGTLAILQVKCTQPGGQVFVDSIPLGNCPFTKRITLTAGRHLVTAKKPGFVPFSKDIVLPARKVAGIDVVLKPMTQVMKLKKVERYPLSWSLTSAIGGLVLVGVGSGMVYYGRSEIDGMLTDVTNYSRLNKTAFDNEVYDPVREDRAVMMQKVGIGLLTVGGVAVVTGAYFYMFRYKMVPIMVTGGTSGDGGAMLKVKVDF